MFSTKRLQTAQDKEETPPKVRVDGTLLAPQWQATAGEQRDRGPWSKRTSGGWTGVQRPTDPVGSNPYSSWRNKSSISPAYFAPQASPGAIDRRTAQTQAEMASKTKKPNLGKVLVVGGCGFLGHHVVDLLLRDYAATVSVVDLRCSNNRRPDADGVRYFEGDITDADRLAAVFDETRPDVVIHTASPAVHSQGKVANALLKKVNVDGTRGVIEACRKTRVRALVYTSSASILSDNVSDLINADERWPVIRGENQTEYYSETKAGAPPARRPGGDARC